MFRGLRAWREQRKQKKQAKYAEELGWMDRDQLSRIREQQSPLRSRGSSSIRR